MTLEKKTMNNWSSQEYIGMRVSSIRINIQILNLYNSSKFSFLYETLPKEEEEEEGKIQSLYTFEDHSISLSWILPAAAAASEMVIMIVIKLLLAGT